MTEIQESLDKWVLEMLADSLRREPGTAYCACCVAELELDGNGNIVCPECDLVIEVDQKGLQK